MKVRLYRKAGIAMRYVCSSCGRVFHLASKVESPCPACGTMLQLSGEEDEAPGEAEAPAQEPSAGGSWLMDDASDGPPVGASALGLDSAAPPPSPSQAMPSAASWVGAGEEGEAAAEEEDAESADAAERFAAATQQMDFAPEETAVTQRRYGSSTRDTAVLPVVRAPSGMKVLVATTASILITLVIAVAVVVLVQKKKTPGAAADAVAVSTSSEAAEIARLEIAVKDLRTEAANYKEERDKIKSERDAAETDLAKLRGEAEGLKAGLERRGEATRKALAALELLERRVELAEALSLADDALREEPNFIQAHRVRGRILAASGRVEEALAAFENADGAAGTAGLAGDAEALVLAGELALTDLGDPAKAVAYYKRAAELETESAHGLVGEARQLMLEGKPAEAEAKAAAAEKADPSLALAPLIRGELAHDQSAQAYRPGAQKKELRKKANDLFLRALRLDPNSTRACVARGKLLIEEAELASAKPGFGLLRLGQQAQAEGLLSKALKLSPKLPEVHRVLAELRLGAGALRDPAVAKIRAKEAVRLTRGKNAAALATFAAAQYASGDPEGAAGTMKLAIELEPTNSGYLGLHKRYETEAKALKP